MLNSVAGSIIFPSGPSKRLTKNVKQKTFRNTTYCDTPGFQWGDNTETGEAISNLLHLGGTCKVIFVVDLYSTDAGGWISPYDNAGMRLILEAAPEIKNNFGIIVNGCSEEEMNKLSSSEDIERFAENIFKFIKPEHHNGSIHFVKEDDNLENTENNLLEASEIQDLKDFLNNKVPVIEITKNMSNNVKAEKYKGKI